MSGKWIRRLLSLALCVSTLACEVNGRIKTHPDPGERKREIEKRLEELRAEESKSTTRPNKGPREVPSDKREHQE